MSRRDLILATISDLVIDFCVYNREDDEELTNDDLLQAIDKGEITISEMAKAFKKGLKEHLGSY